MRVTGEACPHHFTLTDGCLRDRNTNFKMSPPLRTKRDVQAILNGLRDGTLDVISTDHAPHAEAKRPASSRWHPTASLAWKRYMPVCITTLIKNDILTWTELIEKLTINPARVLGIDRGTLKPGAIADVPVMFADWKVSGRADVTIVGGFVRFTHDG